MYQRKRLYLCEVEFVKKSKLTQVTRELSMKAATAMVLYSVIESRLLYGYGLKSNASLYIHPLYCPGIHISSYDLSKYLLKRAQNV